MASIDLNCDMGEFTDEAAIAKDAALMDFVSSVNIACGAHAGDETTMRRTAENALAKGVAVGAHPGYADKDNFGRTEMDLRMEEVYELVSEQVKLMKKITEDLGGRLHHVKPHGALYNQAAKDAELAHVIARAVKDIDAGLVFYGLANSHLISEAQKLGLGTASEVFADRTYQPDGSLTSRKLPGALITDTYDAVVQVLEMVTLGKVKALNGERIRIDAETVCIHGDGEHALEFAQAVREALERNRIKIFSHRDHRGY
ncbi:MAG TPA: 5-oxoprolinase subunit PxpA [Pyrinomonadaceae bacterium]|nr:5-oxoprolinase subunit PxpA [Pyrinomonadaceae bacterium]